MLRCARNDGEGVPHPQLSSLRTQGTQYAAASRFYRRRDQYQFRTVILRCSPLRRASKDESATVGPSPFEGHAARGHLRVTEIVPCGYARDGYVSAFSRHGVPEVLKIIRPHKERAQGMPGARCKLPIHPTPYSFTATFPKCDPVRRCAYASAASSKSKTRSTTGGIAWSARKLFIVAKCSTDPTVTLMMSAFSHCRRARSGLRAEPRQNTDLDDLAT